MIQEMLSGRNISAAILFQAACIAVLWSASAAAQEGDVADRRRARFAISAGFDVWDDLRELRPQAPGEFESGGFVIDFAAHWRMKRWGSNDLLFGFDVGGFSHDSDVFHVRDDVTTRGLYLTPSVKWQLGSPGGPRYSFDIGLGYYLVDFAEVASFSNYRYYGYYCCYSEVQLWEDSSLGGFIGATVDFGRAGRRRGGFTMGTKIHWLDLGTVRDEGRLRTPATLGSNAGRFQGPVYSVQFGYAF